ARAAIFELHVEDGSAMPEPRQRGDEIHLLVLGEAAEGVLVVVGGHEPVEQLAALVDRAGEVRRKMVLVAVAEAGFSSEEGAAAHVEDVGPLGLGLLRDDVDDPTGLRLAVENRARALQYLDALNIRGRRGAEARRKSREPVVLNVS